MRVLDHRGTIHGTVDTLEAEQFRITRRGMNGLEEHWMPFAAVEWVDHAVHLHQGMSETGAIGGAGGGARSRWLRWPARPLAWTGALGGLAQLAVDASHAMRSASGAPGPGRAAGVALPGGRSVTVAPGSVADDLQHFLGSPPPVPRPFP